MSAVPESVWDEGLLPERPKVVAQKPVAKPTPSTGFPVTWVSDAVLKLDSTPVIKGLIEQGSFVVIYGPSGSGKSFFTADIVQHIATGQSWRGRRVTAGLVVYVASEAGASILKRFVGWRDNRMGDATERIPIAVLTRGPSLVGGVDVDVLITQLKELQETAKLPLSTIVFDTLSRSMPGGDENKAEDMTQAVKAADDLRGLFNCATIFVHHSGKDADRGARGHSSLFAAADLVLKISDNVATVEKIRDGVASETFGFALEPIEIGTDSDGEPVFTCLLNHGDAENRPKRSAPMKGRTAIGLKTLKETLETCGQILPGTSTIPNGVKAVKLTEWRERFDLRYGTEGDKSHARQAFYKARESLIEANAISISDPYVWLT